MEEGGTSLQATPPAGDAMTERKLFGGAETEEDADLALARVLQEQERELYYIAQQNYQQGGTLKEAAGEGSPLAAFQERSINSLHTDYESDDSDLNDEQLAARLQQEELRQRMYYDTSGRPAEFAENAPYDPKADETPEDFTYEDFSTLGDSVGTVKLGLSQDKIDSMRTVQYASASDEYTDEKCAICQVEFEEGEDALLLPCKHLFHADCIDIWLADNKCCPVCKQEIED